MASVYGARARLTAVECAHVNSEQYKADLGCGQVGMPQAIRSGAGINLTGKESVVDSCCVLSLRQPSGMYSKCKVE